MFGVGFYQGYRQADERIRTRRAKVNQAFQQWKADNPYATAADFQNAVRAIGGGDFTVATALPGQQAIQRMAADNQRKKQEAEQAKQFEAMERKLRYQNSLTSAVSNAVQLMGDKADAATIANQLGIPVEQVAPAVERAKAQAAQAENDRQRKLFNEGIAYQNTLAQQALNAGLRGDDFDTFISQGMNEYSRRTGLTLSSGTVGGEPSSEQAAMTANASRYRMLADAAEENDATQAYNTLIQLSNTPAFKAQVLEDPTAAIDSLITSAQLDLSDNVLAMARAKLETSVGEKAKAWRQEKHDAAVATITPVYEAALAEDPNSIVDQTSVDAVVREQIIQQNPDLSAAAVDAALAEVKGNAQGALELKYNQTYQNPEQALGTQIASKKQAADSIVEGMMGKQTSQGFPLVGNNIFNVNMGEAAIISDALSNLAYADTAEGMDIASEMAKFIIDQKSEGKGTPNANALIAHINENRNIRLQRFDEYLQDMQAVFIEEINHEFTSTDELIANDKAAVAEDDAAFILRKKEGDVKVDITEDAIRATADIGKKTDRQAALRDVEQALQLELAGARAHLEAFINNAMSIANMTGVDPQYRMAYGVELDRQAYAGAVAERIADLEKRLSLIPSLKANNSDTANDGGMDVERWFPTDESISAPGAPPNQVEIPGVPNQIVGFMNVGGGNRKPGRDVSFSEVLSATPEQRQHFEYSLVDTFAANPAIGNVFPAIYSAVVNDGVPDQRVVQAIARGLEAYDYFHGNAPRGRSQPTTVNQYKALLDELMPGLADSAKEGAGWLPGQARDEHAQQFALSWFAHSLAGMDEAARKQLMREFTGVLSQLKSDAVAASGRAFGNNYTNEDGSGQKIILDLPRLREIAF